MWHGAAGITISIYKGQKVATYHTCKAKLEEFEKNHPNLS